MTKEQTDYVLERFDQSTPEIQRGIVAMLVEDREILAASLERLIALQSHYSKLLNDYDGGARQPFESAQEWVDRLHELGNIPRTVTV